MKAQRIVVRVVRGWNRSQRVIAGTAAAIELGLALLLLSAFSARGPHDDTAQYAFGWLGLFLVFSAIVCGLSAALIFEWED